MRSRRESSRRARALLLATVLLSASGVATVASSGAQDPAPPATPLVTIYSSLPLQGDSRPQSVDVVRAMRMALEANQGRAGSFAVDYVSLDDATKKLGRWDERKVRANARKAARDPDTVAYLGEFNSDASRLSIPILNRAGILQISPSNTSVGLTRSRGAMKGEPDKYYPTGERTYGRVVPAEHIQARALVSLMKETRCGKAYIVHSPEPYGIGMANQVERLGKKRGLKIAANRGFDPEARTHRGLAKKIKASGADCFFFGGITFFSAVDVFNAVADVNPGINMFGPDGLAEAAFTEGLRRRVQRNVLLTNPTLSRRSYPAAGRRFFADFKAKYGKYPEPYAIYGYETMALALDAIARAGAAAGPSRDGRQAIIDAFFATRDRKSVLGTYDIDKKGDTTLSDFGVFRVERGKVVFDRVIQANAP
jgi:branched-chain amino acid transport system substrate-binding protein